MNPYEFFKQIEGIDNDGNPKAIITVQNETMPKNEGEEPLVHDEAFTTQAIANFAIQNNMLVAGLLWEDFDDSEYIRFKGFLKEYEHDTKAVDDNPQHYVILNLADAGNYEHFITAVMTNYIVEREKPMIRFLCKLDESALYQLNDDEMATMTNEIADELDYEDDLEDVTLM